MEFTPTNAEPQGRRLLLTIKIEVALEPLRTETSPAQTMPDSVEAVSEVEEKAAVSKPKAERVYKAAEGEALISRGQLGYIHGLWTELGAKYPQDKYPVNRQTRLRETALVLGLDARLDSTSDLSYTLASKLIDILKVKKKKGEKVEYGNE